MASPILKLEQGGDTLNINSGRYCVDEARFMPPTTAQEVRFGRVSLGSELASKRRTNRSWSFDLTIEAASISEAERAIRDLQAFLNRAGQSRSEPLYLAYRAYSDYDFEPYFGQFGAFIRYEIVNAKAEITSANYLNPLTNSGRVLSVAVDLVMKPYGRGLEQRAAQADGFVFDDYANTPDGTPQGVSTADAITNDFTNPVFMNSTYDTGWSVDSGLIKSENKKSEYIRIGTSSVRLAASAANVDFYQSLSLSAVTRGISCYAKTEDGTQPAAQMYYNGSAQTTSYTALGDGWYRLSASIIGSGGAAEVGIRLTSIGVVYVDGFLSKIGEVQTPVIYGDLPGCSWSGTVHASASTSTAGEITIKQADFLPVRIGYTIRLVWYPANGTAAATDDVLTWAFFEDDNEDIKLTYDTASGTFIYQVDSGQSAASSVFVPSDGVPVILHITYDGSTITIYRAGSSVGSGSSKTAPTANPTEFYIGNERSGGSPANHCGGIIAGLATFTDVMSATEVLADYNQVVQQANDNQRIDAIPYLWTNDGDDVIDNEQNTNDRNFGFISGLMGDSALAEVYALNSATYDSSYGLIMGTVPTSPALINVNNYDDENASKLFAVDGAGTADTSANNDVTERQSQNTTALEYVDTDELGQFYPLVRGQEIWGLTAYKDAGANLQLRLVVNLGSEKLYSDWRSVSSDNSNYLVALLGPVVVPDNPRILDADQKIGFAIEAKRTVSGAANLDVSHALYLPNCTYADANKMQTPSGADAMYIREREVIAVNSSGSTTLGLGRVPLLPRPIKLEPNKINGLLVQMASDGQQYNPDLTADFDKISITPLWDIY